MKERLISIVNEKKRGTLPFLLGLLLAASLCGCALVNAAKPIAKEDPSDPIRDPGASMGGVAPDQAPAPASTPDSTAFPGVTDPELQKVLLGEAQLTCLLGDVSQTVSIQDVPALFDPDCPETKISQYAVIDLDGDGQEEVVLQVIAPAGDMGGFLILHREDSTVWGYLYSYRSLTYLKTDGSFRGSSSLGESWWTATVRFNGGVLVTDQHLFASTPDHSENFVYEIDGQPATKEAFDAGMAEQGNKPDALWYDFVPTMAQLLESQVIADVTADLMQHLKDDQNNKAAAAYAEVLQDILIDGTLPDGSEYPSSAAYDTFALCDVDGDGHDELIVYCVSTITAGHRGYVLSYDPASGTVQERFSGYPSFHFYENGAIREDWSHSQGWAGDSFWPYHLWSLDRETGAYVERGAVDAWDKRVNPNNFPQDVDADGDGMLYQLFLTDEDWYHYQSPSAYVDGAEYARWRDEYTQGTAELFVDFTPLTAEYIRLLKSGGWYDVKG